jgi:hypothetical protein
MNLHLPLRCSIEDKAVLRAPPTIVPGIGTSDDIMLRHSRGRRLQRKATFVWASPVGDLEGHETKHHRCGALAGGAWASCTLKLRVGCACTCQPLAEGEPPKRATSRWDSSPASGIEIDSICIPRWNRILKSSDTCRRDPLMTIP